MGAGNACTPEAEVDARKRATKAAAPRTLEAAGRRTPIYFFFPVK